MQLIRDIENTKDPMTQKNIVMKECSYVHVDVYLEDIANTKIFGRYLRMCQNTADTITFSFEKATFLYDYQELTLKLIRGDIPTLEKFNENYIHPTPKKQITLPKAIDLLDNLIGMVEDNHNNDYDMAIKLGIKALKELQNSKQILEQYESLGTPTQIIEKIGGLDVELGKYACLGTVEDFREALDKASAYDEFLAEQGLLEENPDILRR